MRVAYGIQQLSSNKKSMALKQIIGEKEKATTTVVMTPESAAAWSKVQKQLRRCKARKRRIAALYLDGDLSEAARLYELERPTMEQQAKAKKEAADEAQLQLALAAGDMAALDNFLGQRDHSSRGTFPSTCVAWSVSIEKKHNMRMCAEQACIRSQLTAYRCIRVVDRCIGVV